MPDNKWGWTYKIYPLWQFEWCGYCSERMEFKRIGSGRIKRDPRRRPVRDWAGLVLRDYRYAPIGDPHTCEGQLKAAAKMQETTRKMTAFLNRMVGEILSR